MNVKFAVVIIVILAVSFSLSYLSGFTNSETVSNLTDSKTAPGQFYEIWLYIGAAIGLVLLITTITYKIRK